MKKQFRHVLVELVALAIVVGLIPGLAVGAVEDLFGPCGFDAVTCHEFQVQGVVKSAFVFVFSLLAVLLAFWVSREFDDDEQ